MTLHLYSSFHKGEIMGYKLTENAIDRFPIARDEALRPKEYLPEDVDVLVLQESVLVGDFEEGVVYDGICFGRDGQLLREEEIDKINPKVRLAIGYLATARTLMKEDPELFEFLQRSGVETLRKLVETGEI